METTTTRHRPRSSLTLALQVDAALVAVAGLALTLGANPLGDLLDLDPGFLRTVGIALLPWAGWVIWVCREPGETMVRSVVVGNALWVIASVLVLALSLIEPNAFGIAFVLLQAILVAGIAGWQVTAHRAALTMASAS